MQTMKYMYKDCFVFVLFIAVTIRLAVYNLLS